MTFPVRLYFLRLAGLLAQSTLLIVGTVLFAFGMLDLFNVLALLGLGLAWGVIRPSTVREVRTLEYVEHDLSSAVDNNGRRLEVKGADGITLERYLSLGGFRARTRVRKELSLRRDRFDITLAVLTTLVWLSYFGFISSVIAGA